MLGMSPTNVQYRIHTNFILISIALLLGCVFYVITPFISTLFNAAVTVTAFSPVQKWAQQYIKSNLLCSITLFFSIVLLFVVPVGFLGWALVEEAADVSEQITNAANDLPAFLNALPSRLESVLPAGAQWQQQLTVSNLSSLTADMAGQASSILLKSATSLLAGVSMFFLHLLIFLFALFYLLLDGKRLVKYTRTLLPLAEKQKNELVQKTTDLMQSIVYGLFGASMAQGALMGIGMALIGITNPVFWGTIGALFSPIPYVGASLIWFPTMIWLFSTGQWGKGVFFAAWCIILVANIDNIVKPYLIGAKSLMHPFLVMLVILGGVLTLGFKGLVFGPLLLTLLIAFLHIYELEFAKKTSSKS